jgi:hypothetical protein
MIQEAASRQNEIQRQGATLIYLVDDDASFLRALSRRLRAAGYRVETFGSAEEFLTRRRSDAAGCAVLDLQMPGPGGLELQEALWGGSQASKNVCRDPRGPTESYDPGDPYAPKRVVKGGSFLCNPFLLRKLSSQRATRNAGRYGLLPYGFRMRDLWRQYGSHPFGRNPDFSRKIDLF